MGNLDTDQSRQPTDRTKSSPQEHIPLSLFVLNHSSVKDVRQPSCVGIGPAPQQTLTLQQWPPLWGTFDALALTLVATWLVFVVSLGT